MQVEAAQVRGVDVADAVGDPDRGHGIGLEQAVEPALATRGRAAQAAGQIVLVIVVVGDLVDVLDLVEEHHGLAAPRQDLLRQLEGGQPLAAGDAVALGADHRDLEQLHVQRCGQGARQLGLAGAGRPVDQHVDAGRAGTHRLAQVGLQVLEPAAQVAEAVAAQARHADHDEVVGEQAEAVAVVSEQALADAVQQVDLGRELVLAVVVHARQAGGGKRAVAVQGLGHGLDRRAEHGGEHRVQMQGGQVAQRAQRHAQVHVATRHHAQQQHLRLQLGQAEFGAQPQQVARHDRGLGQRGHARGRLLAQALARLAQRVLAVELGEEIVRIAVGRPGLHADEGQQLRGGEGIAAAELVDRAELDHRAQRPQAAQGVEVAGPGIGVAGAVQLDLAIRQDVQAALAGGGAVHGWRALGGWAAMFSQGSDKTRHRPENPCRCRVFTG